jgi:hypothetical protein
MNIGLIVHSYPGHTLEVAGKLKDALLAAGHRVSVAKIEVLGGENPKTECSRLNRHRIQAALTPHFWRACTGIFAFAEYAAYLTKIRRLPQKKALCFVTKQLPFPWMGGRRAAGQMEEMLKKRERRFWIPELSAGPKGKGKTISTIF